MRTSRLATAGLAVVVGLLAGCRTGERPGTVAARASKPAAGVTQATTAARAAPLAGYPTAEELNQGTVALSSTDVAFYLRVMKAALARTQHPSSADAAALGADGQWRQAQAAEARQVQAALQAHHPGVLAGLQSPAQPASADLAEALAEGRADQMSAASQGMPPEQWTALRDAVEGALTPCARPLPAANAADIAQQWSSWVASCEGGSGDNPLAGLSAAQLQAANRQAAVLVQNLGADRRTAAASANAVNAVRQQLLQSADALARQYGIPDPEVQAGLQLLRIQQTEATPAPGPR